MTDPVAPWQHDRAFRNHNPGNLRPRSGPPWPGQGGVEVGPQGSYAVFTNATEGWCALGLWCLYARHVRGLQTAREMIEVFAPPSDDNPTSAYAAYVEGRLGSGPLNLDDNQTLLALVRAIAQWEDHRVLWPAHELESGLTLCLLRWPVFRATMHGHPPPTAAEQQTAEDLNAAELKRLHGGSDTA